jgi:hypothetical protein
MADRAFSNEFFRPSRTTGIWLVGDTPSRSHYELMVGQGYNTEGLTPSQTGNNFAVAGTFFRDYFGDYGPARPTDFEYHEDLAVRLGLSLVFSREGTPGRQLEEADFLRLSDGTRITEVGALVPGVKVDSFDVQLVALDGAYKYRGWSANSEFFLRSINNLAADQPVPSLGLQYGFYCEGGVFLQPKKLEFNTQYAFVDGNYGASNSYAAGFSWYPRRAQYLKWTLDGTYIDGSPVNSTGADILVGEKGFLTRLQIQALF